MHVHPAGVGREIAADLAGALAAEAEREQAVRGLGRRLHCGQGAAGLGDQPFAARVDRADPVEAGEAEDHLPAAHVGNAAADQPGIAALRHDRHPGARRRAPRAPPPRRSCAGAGRPPRRHRCGARSRPRRVPGRPLPGAPARARRSRRTDRGSRRAGRLERAACGAARRRWRCAGDDRAGSARRQAAAVDTVRAAGIPERSFERRVHAARQSGAA